MPILKLKVRCYKCNKEVDKLEAKEVPSIGTMARYECFPCFKKVAQAKRPKANTERRFDLFCDRCRYKFSSKTIMCPYCNKDDQLHKGKVTAFDLV